MWVAQGTTRNIVGCIFCQLEVYGCLAGVSFSAEPMHLLYAAHLSSLIQWDRVGKQGGREADNADMIVYRASGQCVGYLVGANEDTVWQDE